MVDETRIPSPGDGSPSHPGPIPPGTLLFGVYEVLDQLGSGGMGDVYRARHRQLGGLRAIKVIHPAFAGRPEAVELFYREARAMLEVHHDAVVRCHDLLTGDDGRVYLVMEMVEGPGLAEWIRQGPLSESAVRALGARIASGLAAAHRCGVVHRDLSPDNIVLSEGRPDRAKLIDFGIAKILESGDLTVVSGFKGKISYASPEQFGLYGGRVSPRSDLYSLGLVLAAAASGTPLPMGATVAEAVQSRQRLPAIPTGIPPSLRAELSRLLAPDPADRPESAEGLFTSVPLPEKSPPGVHGRSWVVATLAGAALVAALIVWPSLRDALSGLVGRTTATPTTETPIAPDVSPRTPEIAEMPSEPPATAPLEPFDRLRARLIELQPVSDTRARVWTTPDPVPSGARYQVAFEADCACAALLFSVNGDHESIDLLYPNTYDEPRRLAPGEPIVLPPGEQYQLTAEASPGEDTLKLLLFRGEPGFPPDLDVARFIAQTKAEFSIWSARRGDAERLAELEALVEREAWAAAHTPLRILP